MKLAYTVKEAAEELGLAPLTVRKLIRDGELVARKCGSERGILIGRAAIEAFLATPDPKVIVYTVPEIADVCAVTEEHIKTLIQIGLMPARCCGDFRRSKWKFVRIGAEAAGGFINRGSREESLLSDVASLSKVDFFAKYAPHLEPPPDEVIPRSQTYRKHTARVFKRDKYTCVYCGRKDRLTIDHVIPVSRGGDDSLKNLATCCHWCNCSKKAKTREEFLEWREARLS